MSFDFDQGYRARERGEPISECPYEDHTASHEAWCEGWWMADNFFAERCGLIPTTTVNG